MVSFGCKTGHTKKWMLRELVRHTFGHICESLQRELECRPGMNQEDLPMEATLSMTSVD